MNIMYWALIGLGAFIAIWMLFVVPAERRDHERKLEMIQRKIEKRQTQTDQDNYESSAEQNNDKGDS